MKEMLRYGVILSVICVIASGLLAGVYSLAKPQIDKQAVAELEISLMQVLPQAVSFEPVKSGEEILYYKGYTKEKKSAGIVFKATAKGYSSTIETLVGASREGKIIAIKVISQNETPGLGTRVTETTFTDQFINKGVADMPKVSTISGATISSSAVINTVKKKLEEIQKIAK